MRRLRGVLLGLVLCSLAACVAPQPNPRFWLRFDNDWSINDLDSLLERFGDRDVGLADLGRTGWLSLHLAVVRTAEPPHYHRDHDMTVSVLRGQGILHAGRRHIRMGPGDVAHIHRGTPHFFENTGDEASAALVVFSPPFDGRDRVLLQPTDGTPQPTEGNAP